MTGKDVSKQLNRIASSTDFAGDSEELCDEWTATGAGVEVIEPILRFMEQHPTADFGVPGPLVHFVERFYRNGYEGQLLASIKRKPTSHTVWMLNRLINGARTPKARRLFMDAMERAKLHPLVNEPTLESIRRFAD